MRHYLIETNLFENFNPQRFIERLQGVISLIQRGSTEGERSAAQAAFDRMLDVWKTNIQDMRTNGASPSELNRLETMLRSTINVLKQTSSEKPPEKKKNNGPYFKIGQWVSPREGNFDVWQIVSVDSDGKGGWVYNTQQWTYPKPKKGPRIKKTIFKTFRQDELRGW